MTDFEIQDYNIYDLKAGKTCPICDRLKPMKEYYKRSDRPDGYHSQCKECYVITSAMKRYSLTREEILKELETTHCTCCGDELHNRQAKKLDHDYTTGKYRGVVCNICNVGIGYLEGERVSFMLDYIDKHK